MAENFQPLRIERRKEELATNDPHASHANGARKTQRRENKTGKREREASKKKRRTS
jgi:hypothetical protein